MKDKGSGGHGNQLQTNNLLTSGVEAAHRCASRENIYEHLRPDEQKRCRKNSRGNKDQLLIDKMIIKDKFYDRLGGL